MEQQIDDTTLALHRRLDEVQKLANRLQSEQHAAYRQLISYAADLKRVMEERDWAVASAARVSGKMVPEGADRCRGVAVATMGTEDRPHPDHQNWLTLAREKDQLHKIIRQTKVESLLRLTAAAELKDLDTGLHMERIGYFSALLADVLGKDASYCADLFYASRMHDIGKIGIPDNVLHKPAGLTEDEWRIMSQHPVIGANLLRSYNDADDALLNMAADIALNHHEKYDGSGYPYKLAGEKIPLSARIVSLVDFFDALTMDRCYRPGLSDEDVLPMIRERAGTHFDPGLVQVFLNASDRFILARGKINRGEMIYYYA